MKAEVGDWLVLKGTTTEHHDQRGLITEVHGWMACDSSWACVRDAVRLDLCTKVRKTRLCPIQHNRVGGLSGFS